MSAAFLSSFTCPLAACNVTLLMGDADLAMWPAAGLLDLHFANDKAGVGLAASFDTPSLLDGLACWRDGGCGQSGGVRTAPTVDVLSRNLDDFNRGGADCGYNGAQVTWRA